MFVVLTHRLWHQNQTFKHHKTSETFWFNMNMCNFLFYCRWKTHKWSKCHLAPWLVRQNSSGAQETCGTGLQTRGAEPHLLRDITKSPDVSLSSFFNVPFVSGLSCPVPCPLALSCLQLNGTQADVSDCLEFATAMPSITQPCQLPCQDDCQLTNWSKFSSCTVDCVGVRIRKRTLIGGSRTMSWYLHCI